VARRAWPRRSAAPHPRLSAAVRAHMDFPLYLKVLSKVYQHQSEGLGYSRKKSTQISCPPQNVLISGLSIGASGLGAMTARPSPGRAHAQAVDAVRAGPRHLATGGEPELIFIPPPPSRPPYLFCVAPAIFVLYCESLMTYTGGMKT
jgi:hypothetical protein